MNERSASAVGGTILRGAFVSLSLRDATVTRSDRRVCKLDISEWRVKTFAHVGGYARRSRSRRLVAAGQRGDLYLFPDTDHGIFEFHTNPDGSRTMTRIADGSLKLLAHWIKGDVHGSYGRAERLR